MNHPDSVGEPGGFLADSPMMQFASPPGRQRAERLIETFLIVAGCFLLTILSIWLGLQVEEFTEPLYPLAGFVLACLLRFSWRAFLPALGGILLGSLAFHEQTLSGVQHSVVSVIGASLGWQLLRRLRRKGKTFTLISSRDVLQLIVCGGVPVALLAASFSVWVQTSDIYPLASLNLWLASFFRVVAGVTVFSPAAFFLLEKDFGMPVQQARREAFILFGLLAISILFSVFFLAQNNAFEALCDAVPYAALLSIALRLGLRPVALSIAAGVLGLLFALAIFDRNWHGLVNSTGMFSLVVALACGSCLLVGAQRDAINASEMQARLAMSGADFCQWEWTLERGLKFHSAAWTRRIGLEADLFLPLERWLETIHPNDNGLFASAINAGAKERTPGFKVRFRSLDAETGKWFWSQSVGLIVKNDADQHPLQAIGVVLDIDSDVAAEQMRIQTIHNQAELDTLRAQLNPHFLFNCLNSVRALIGRDEKSAREMVTSLSSLLRYLLKAKKRTFETVESEMAVVLKYLGIEQIRFGHSLRIETSIDPGALHAQVPSMVILTLVENAIKHGISKRKDGGLVLIEIREKALSLEIIVTNDGTLDEDGSGVGLANTRRRMQLLTGDAALFQLTSPREGQVVARLTIPYKDINL